MRTLKRNQQKFWYALYTGETEQVDGSGNYTGEIGPSYAEAVQTAGNISAARGNAEMEFFGSDLQYSRTIAMDGTDYPITEETAIWIDLEPTDTNGNAVPHNYVVKGIAKSLNHLVYAVDEVKNSATPPPVPPTPDDPDDPDDPDGPDVPDDPEETEPQNGEG